jgi:hypothetical protein
VLAIDDEDYVVVGNNEEEEFIINSSIYSSENEAFNQSFTQEAYKDEELPEPQAADEDIIEVCVLI